MYSPVLYRVLLRTRGDLHSLLTKREQAVDGFLQFDGVTELCASIDGVNEFGDLQGLFGGYVG